MEAAFVSHVARVNDDEGLTSDGMTFMGWNPDQKPTLPGPVSSYGIHGCLKSALATEWLRG